MREKRQTDSLGWHSSIPSHSSSTAQLPKDKDAITVAEVNGTTTAIAVHTSKTIFYRGDPSETHSPDSLEDIQPFETFHAIHRGSQLSEGLI